MKKITILLTSITILVACNKTETLAPVTDTITALIEQEAPLTKTYMDASNNIRWSEGDQVVAFMKSSYGHKYQLISSFAGKTYADFSIVSSGSGNLSAGTEWDHNVVYYPYSDTVEAEKSGSNYALDVVLSSEQTYAPESFGNGTMAMVAVSEDNNITFRNILGGMKLQLKGTQMVTSITIQGKNSEKLSGAATVTAYTDETKPAITMASDASTSITLNCGSGVQLNESTATEFIIALPPVLFSKGFTVTVTDSDSKTYTVETDKANTVLRSSLLTMPSVELSAEKDECPEDNNVYKKVLLIYSAGFNSLREYLLDDINDLKQGWLPGKGCDDDVLLVYTHTPKSNSAYSTPTTPYLIRLSRDGSGNTVCDTLKRYDENTISSSAAQLNEVLTYIRDNYAARSYGMIFSSHATGYLPAGFYSNPDGYVFSETGMMKSRGISKPKAVPYIEPEYDPSLPMVKSIGQDVTGPVSDRQSYEMDLPDFAEAIPMKLDYILFDACLMGGIEVAYELREKCSKVGFSQAEVLVEGLDYKTLTEHLLKRTDPYPRGVCEDYFNQYDTETGVYRSATISLIDCERLEPLAEVCRAFFASHREGLASIDPDKVQRFYRFSHHWFYDLESIMTEAGANENEIAGLHNALYQCVLYKGHTPEFMCEFDINTFSGFSMYLPCNGNAELDKFYKTLSWNQETGLVE